MAGGSIGLGRRRATRPWFSDPHRVSVLIVSVVRTAADRLSIGELSRSGIHSTECLGRGVLAGPDSRRWGYLASIAAILSFSLVSCLVLCSRLCCYSRRTLERGLCDVFSFCLFLFSMLLVVVVVEVMMFAVVDGGDCGGGGGVGGGDRLDR